MQGTLTEGKKKDWAGEGQRQWSRQTKLDTAYKCQTPSMGGRKEGTGDTDLWKVILSLRSLNSS